MEGELGNEGLWLMILASTSNFCGFCDLLPSEAQGAVAVHIGNIAYITIIGASPSRTVPQRIGDGHINWGCHPIHPLPECRLQAQKESHGSQRVGLAACTCLLTLFCILVSLSRLQALKTSKADRGTRVGKMPQLAEFQFFNTKRLTELYEREHAYEQHKAILGQKEANLKQQVRVCACVCVGGMGRGKFVEAFRWSECGPSLQHPCRLVSRLVSRSTGVLVDSWNHQPIATCVPAARQPAVYCHVPVTLMLGLLVGGAAFTRLVLQTGTCDARSMYFTTLACYIGYTPPLVVGHV